MEFPTCNGVEFLKGTLGPGDANGVESTMAELFRDC